MFLFGGSDAKQEKRDANTHLEKYSHWGLSFMLSSN